MQNALLGNIRMLLQTAPFAVILLHTYNQHPLPKCFHTLSAGHISLHHMIQAYSYNLYHALWSKTLITKAKKNAWVGLR